PAGVSYYTTRPFDTPGKVLFRKREGDTRLLRVDLRSDVGAALRGRPARDAHGALFPGSGLLPLEVSSSHAGGTLDTRLRVVPPKSEEDFTATIDVYVEPWGTHPN